MKPLALLAALAACSNSSDSETWLSAVHALDGDSAVALFRAGDGVYSIGMIDAKGAVRWRTKIPGAPYVIGPYNGINVVGDLATIRYGHVDGYRKSDHAVAAFSLRDGKQLWNTTIAKYEPTDLGEYGKSEAGLPLYVSSIPVDGKLAVFTDTGTTGNRFDAIDVGTGKIVATSPADNDIAYAPVAIGPRLFTHRVNQTTSYDVSGAPAQHMNTAYEGCAIGDEYIVIERKSHGDEVTLDLVAYKNGAPESRRVIASPFQPIEEKLLTMRRCGRYRDRMVLLIQANEKTYVVITDANGQPLERIDLGFDMLWDGPGADAKKYTSTASLAGELTRFVPYAQVTHGPGVAAIKRLVMLDLEEGKIAWAGPEDDGIIHMSMFRSGTRWLTFWPTRSGILSSFDGATGELTGSMRLHVYDGIGEVAPYHAAGNRIWIYGGTKGSASKPTIGVLDATTLEPVFARGIKIQNVLAETRKQLGR